MSSIVGVTFVAATIAWSAGARAQEARGRLLYENHCTVCHTSVVHVREDHKAGNLQEVQGFVARWSAYLKLPWTAEDRAAVARYLDETYYRFGTGQQVR